MAVYSNLHAASSTAPINNRLQPGGSLYLAGNLLVSHKLLK
jgi:hypothetical protein